ncbi:DNA-binding protein [Nocardia blacklockiae]|uniref:DNA-binding protein n=1 Tax=Nocardia blacklockiae TaxID=480036 RepID=UPI001894EF8C|nr:DNA-binding protein [Nocardia blacklockiae]MBF6172685.1 DNA-binding protein [Nocardia blacklockiae]
MTESDLPRGIGAPATRALLAAGYARLEQLSGVPERELAALHGVGPKAIRVLRAALDEQGLSLG